MQALNNRPVLPLLPAYTHNHNTFQQDAALARPKMDPFTAEGGRERGNLSISTLFPWLC